MPTRIDSPFKIDELKDIRIHPGFDFTQGVQVMQIPATFGYLNPWRFGDKLFDVKNDPGQFQPLNDGTLSQRYAAALIPMMQQHDAPPELYTRFELDPLTPERDAQFIQRQHEQIAGYACAHPGVAEALAFLIRNSSEDALELTVGCSVDEADIFALIDKLFTGDKHRAMVYQTRLLLRTA